VVASGHARCRRAVASSVCGVRGCVRQQRRSRLHRRAAAGVMKRSTTLAVAVCMWTVLTTGVVLLGLLGPGRVVLAAGFLLICPGIGLATRLRVNDVGDTVLLGVVLSVVLAMVLSQTMAFFDVWSMEVMLLVLAVIAVAGVAL